MGNDSAGDTSDWDEDDWATESKVFDAVGADESSILPVILDAEAGLPGPSESPPTASDIRPISQQIVVRTQEVRKVYRMGDQEIHALRGVSIEIFAGEYLSIMGPSGSGKTTFFNMIGGLDKPTAGKVFIDEVDVAALDAFELAWLRCRKIGYIFQDYSIIPVMTALENVTLPMVFAGLSSEEARDKGVQLLTRVGLRERINHKPFELSGGQQQRVAIARALANDPAIVLADEPTGNLDLRTGAEIIELLGQLKEERGITVVSATHDHKMLKASDRIVWVSDGKVDRIEKRGDVEIQEGHIGDMGDPAPAPAGDGSESQIILAQVDARPPAPLGPGGPQNDRPE